MFYSFNRFIEDWNIGISGHDDLHLSLENKTQKRKALIRVGLKLIATTLIIGGGAIAVSNSDVSDYAIRLSYLGFGFVLGYWFR